MDLQQPGNITFDCILFFLVSDYKLDPQLVKFCKRDVPKFCKDVRPGEGQGRIVECLKQNYDVCFDDFFHIKPCTAELLT